MKILFIGDVVGKPGRKILKEELPKIKKNKNIDLVVVNPENSAHGRGLTASIVEELQEVGVDVFSGGDHSFDEKNQLEEVYGGKYPVMRPANYSPDAPGLGYCIFKKGRQKVLLINLIGRVFMKMDFDCPFREIDKILANFAKQNFSAIIVDIHAEATSEKKAMFHYLDSRVSAVLGTHTHVMTNDDIVSDYGTAYITDVGMTGFSDGCIGIEKRGVIETFLTQIKTSHTIPEEGRAEINAVLLEVDTKTKKALKIDKIKKQSKHISFE